MAIPNAAQLASYGVTNADQYEGATQSLYDFQAYPVGGATSFNFFAVPQGSGGKTFDDTNMILAAQIPAQQIFLVQAVEVHFYPTVPAVTAQNPAVFGAQAAALLVNDVYAVEHAGNLLFTIGSKSYLQEAPLLRMPPKAHFALNAAVTDTTPAAASSQSRIAYAWAAGTPYNLSAFLKLAPNMSFAVVIGFNTAVAVSNAGRIGVVLPGVLYRMSQ